MENIRDCLQVKDVPIRTLDGLIGGLIVAIVGMIIFFAVRGGFNIVYDTDGGSKVAGHKVRYGEFLIEPETPYKPGYTFDGWYTEKEGETVLWHFRSEKVTGDIYGELPTPVKEGSTFAGMGVQWADHHCGHHRSDDRGTHLDSHLELK